jgi:hypothetical protein
MTNSEINIHFDTNSVIFFYLLFVRLYLMGVVTSYKKDAIKYIQNNIHIMQFIYFRLTNFLL